MNAGASAGTARGTGCIGSRRDADRITRRGAAPGPAWSASRTPVAM